MSRYTILDARGVPVQIGLVADSRESALRIWGLNRAGGPYTARLETGAETKAREQNAARNTPRTPVYTGD